MTIKKKNLNIFLVGPMGAGKSTIGKQLAQELNLPFYDSDEVIVERTGADLAWIYDVEGESGFRKREKDIINDLTQKSGIILATGGGVILEPENRDKLSARGTVVYLSATVEQQLRRTVRDKRRPTVFVMKNPEVEIAQLMVERQPLYQSIADITVSTDGRTVRAVALDVVKMINESMS